MLGPYTNSHNSLLLSISRTNFIFGLTVQPLRPICKCNSSLSYISITFILNLTSIIVLLMFSKKLFFYVRYIQIMAEQLVLPVRQLLEYTLVRPVMLIFLNSQYLKVTICHYHWVLFPLNIKMFPTDTARKTPCNSSAFSKWSSISSKCMIPWQETLMTIKPWEFTSVL